MSQETLTPRPGSDIRDGLSPVAALVRRHDRDRYQTVLFAPPERQQPLFALYAFNYEIARVRETVSEVMLGRIRLQWWREAVAAAYDGGATRRHVVVEPLAETIRAYAPSREHFDRLIDAREIDLAGEPPASLAALEDYAEASSARLTALAAEILGLRDPATRGAAHEIGLGYGLAGLLRAMPFHARTGHSMIPADIADRHGIDPGDYAALRTSPAIRAATQALAEAAAAHLARGREGRRRVPRAALAALLPGVIASRFLVRLRRAGFDPFAPALALPDPLQSWRLVAAALRRRY